jgi:hypothetical protein
MARASEAARHDLAARDAGVDTQGAPDLVRERWHRLANGEGGAERALAIIAVRDGGRRIPP